MRSIALSYVLSMHRGSVVAPAVILHEARSRITVIVVSSLGELVDMHSILTTQFQSSGTSQQS